MKQVKYIAIGMIACSLIAMAVGMSFFFSNSLPTKPEKGKEVYVAEGNMYLDDGEYMLAVASYQKALDMDKTDADALKGSAEAYSAMSYYAEEENVREELSIIEPENLDNWIGLVMVKMNLNQLDDAKALTEDLLAQYDDDNLEALYHQMDVKEPVFNLTPGSYDSYQMLTLQEIPDNAAIHYTTDGSEPTEFSDVYTDGIILSYPENTIKAKAIGFIGYESDVIELDYQITVPTENVRRNISDFEWLISNELNKDWNDPIYNYELAQFRSLYILGEYSHSMEKPMEISFYADGYMSYQSKHTDLGEGNLEILTYMPFLKTLSVGYQKSVDLTNLSNLTYLEELSLLHNNIDDIQGLKDLKELKMLALGWNNISDVTPLAGLSNLESLGLWDNQISDVDCLKGLNSLTYFDVTGNQIQDISCIRSMPNLSELWIARNQISDMTPIDSCENLSVLMLSGNPGSSYNIGTAKAAKLIKTDRQ